MVILADLVYRCRSRYSHWIHIIIITVPAKVVELKNMTRPEGESETLTCIAEGNPTPHMVFHKVGSPIAFEEGDNVSITWQWATGKLDIVWYDLEKLQCLRKKSSFAKINYTNDNIWIRRSIKLLNIMDCVV